MDDIRGCHFHPCIYYDGTSPKDFGAVALSHFSNYTKQEFTSISEVLNTYYATKNTLTRIRQKSADLRHVVQTALERNRKKYDLQKKQLRDTENREKYKVYGAVSYTHLHQYSFLIILNLYIMHVDSQRFYEILH